MNVPVKNPEAMLSKQGVADYLSVNPWTIDRWRKTDPTFPAPFWMNDRTPRWLPTDIRQWLASRPRGGIAPEWEQKPKPRRRRREEA